MAPALTFAQSQVDQRVEGLYQSHADSVAMPEISKDVIAILQYLLPGFLVAWVYFGLTSHPKPSQFERIVQALIFSLVVRVFVFLEQSSLEYIGQWKNFRQWDSEADLVASLLTAVALGLLFAYAVNTDGFHKFIRTRGLSKRSSHPSEWCGTLTNFPSYVVLHLKDERRLFGWPEVWPSDPDKGHFFIITPSWILDDGKDMELYGVEGLLVDVRDVKWIEFIKKPEITS